MSGAEAAGGLRKMARAVGTALAGGAVVWTAGAGAGAAADALLPERPVYRRNAGCAPTLPPPPERMPWSQGDSAICYAYATADMISARVGRRVSALDVATGFYFSDPGRLLLSRDPRLRRHLARRPDLTQAIARERARVDVDREGNPDGRPYFEKLEGGEEDLAALLANVKGLCPEEDLPSDDGYVHVSAWLKAQRVRAGFAPLGPFCPRATGSFPARFSDRAAMAHNEAWTARVDRLCRRFRPAQPLLPVSYRIAAHQEDYDLARRAGWRPTSAQLRRLFSRIDYALDNGRTPTVGYSFYLLQPRAAGDPDEFADHSSTVVGRRKIGGVCHYAVQDNTGELCFKFRPHVASRCVLGRIWLSEKELAGSVYSVIYLR